MIESVWGEVMDVSWGAWLSGLVRVSLRVVMVVVVVIGTHVRWKVRVDVF